MAIMIRGHRVFPWNSRGLQRGHRAFQGVSDDCQGVSEGRKSVSKGVFDGCHDVTEECKMVTMAFLSLFRFVTPSSAALIAVSSLVVSFPPLRGHRYGVGVRR